MSSSSPPPSRVTPAAPRSRRLAPLLVVALVGAGLVLATRPFPEAPETETAPTSVAPVPTPSAGPEAPLVDGWSVRVQGVATDGSLARVEHEGRPCLLVLLDGRVGDLEVGRDYHLEGARLLGRSRGPPVIRAARAAAGS